MQTETNSNSPLHKDGNIGRIAGTVLGGIGGAIIGGPPGALAGASAGGALGGSIGSAIDDRNKRLGKGAYKDGVPGEEDAQVNNYEQLTTDVAGNENRLAILEAQRNSPMIMKSGVVKPIKKLSAITMRYAPIKMKSSEAKRAAFMMKISGASSMPEKY